MAKKFNQQIFASFFVIFLLKFPASSYSSDPTKTDQSKAYVCPYPCLPSPIPINSPPSPPLPPLPPRPPFPFTPPGPIYAWPPQDGSSEKPVEVFILVIVIVIVLCTIILAILYLLGNGWLSRVVTTLATEIKKWVFKEATEVKDRVSTEATAIKGKVSAEAKEIKDRVSKEAAEIKGKLSDIENKLAEKPERLIVNICVYCQCIPCRCHR